MMNFCQQFVKSPSVQTFFLFLIVWIRIRIRNMDPDLLNTDLIWIQIPDTGSKTNFRNFLLRATGKNGTDAARLI